MYLYLLKNHLSNIKELDADIFVYKGLPIRFILEVSKIYPFICDKDKIISNEKINLKGIIETTNEVIAILLQNPDKKGILLYEQFLRIADNVNVTLFKQKYVIVENNVLDEFPNQTDTIIDDIEKTIETDFNELKENLFFSQFYSNSIQKENYNLIQYRYYNNDQVDNVKLHYFFNDTDKNVSFQEKNVDEITSSPNLLRVPTADNSYDIFKVRLFLNEQIDAITIITTHKSLKNQLLYRDLIFIRELFICANKDIQIFLIKPKLQTSFRLDFLDILKQYWKSSAFRELVFYRDPDLSNEKEIISQGAVIEEIVKNSESAINYEDFTDIFLTAPTGSGKSVLFQIPAIYLANKFGLVTIVISPLKALMYDQVIALRSRGIQISAYINSDISLVERGEIIEKINNGDISILYLSPELLLSYDIRTFIGNRKIGLLVIDEAHLVTTWGRDFRVDYWYLGNYIRKLRKYSNNFFPVLALTATAVYSGQNDIVFETIDSLNMQLPKLYIGNIRRDEITFDFNPFTFSGNHEQNKIEKTKDRLISFVERKIKTIIYFPWIRQIEIIYSLLPPEIKKYVGIYYGAVDKDEKQIIMESFKKNEIYIILATKAFGMGVDVSDINCIYHHAPSGNLSDYIQEVGRVARDKMLKGIALLDFCYKDLKFTKILYGLSSIKQYQIKLALQKITDIYNYKRKQNLLISVEDFAFIFDDDSKDIETKIKSTLLLIEKDLLKKYSYNVLLVRPKSLFSAVFANIPYSIEKEFINKYGNNIELIKELEPKYTYEVDDTKYTEQNNGNIYLLKLNQIWENYYSDLSFPMLKKKYFECDLFTEYQEKISPRYHIVVRLKQPYDESLKKLKIYFTVIENSLNYFQGKYFTRDEFEAKLKDLVKDRILRKRIVDLIVNLYTAHHSSPNIDHYDIFIASRFNEGVEELRVISKAFPKVKHHTIRLFSKLFKKNNSDHYDKFIPIDKDRNKDIIKLSYLLESFQIGNYELSGGKYPQIFLRINDPFKVVSLSKDYNYSNVILKDIDNRQKLSISIMERFFTDENTNDDKWNFIENYFLGKNE